jgi:hypothetical protein
MKRALRAVLVFAALVTALGPAHASAKGASSAVIEGPGIKSLARRRGDARGQQEDQDRADQAPRGHH